MKTNMRMPRPWIIVLAGLALALSGATSAKAITQKTANDKAAGYQHYECHAGRGVHCINPDYLRAHCSGPYQGHAQWDCFGAVLLSINGNRDECNVLSRWGPWGNLEFGHRYCTPLTISDN